MSLPDMLFGGWPGMRRTLLVVRDSCGRRLEDAEAVFLESDGSLSALLKSA